MPITTNGESGRTLIYDGLAQTDIDMASHRLLNLDTSNLPPVGIPPTITPPANQWLHAWDAASQTWTATQPRFSDIDEFLTGEQMQRIDQLGRVRIGIWQASPIERIFLPSLDGISPPQANVSMAGFRLVNLANPVDPNDAVNVAYMDFLLQGLQPKEAVRCATTTAITPATLIRPVDGVELESGDRVLVKNQANQAQNGIYIADVGPWPFAPDFDTGPEMERAYCAVLQGDLNSGTSWLQSNPVSLPNTDPKHFLLFSSTPTANFIAGAGLTKDGNTINVAGTASRITVGPDNVDISPSYAGQASIITVGAIGTGTWHGDTIDPARGGTGINNGTKTIELSGNFSTNFALDFPDVGIARSLSFSLVDVTHLTLPTVGTVATINGVEMFTNKRIIKRTQSVASNAKPVINTDVVDVFHITNLGENITSMTDNLTGTATNGQELIIWIGQLSGAFGYSIAWGAKWTASSDLPLPATSTVAARMFLWFVYNSDVAKWVLTQKLDHIP